MAIATSVLWRLGDPSRLRAGRLRLGCRLLRSARIPPRGGRAHRVATGAGLDCGDGALSRGCARHRQSTTPASPLRSAPDDDGRRERYGPGHPGLGHRERSVASVRRGAGERRGLGDHGRRRRQRGDRALVRARPTHGIGEGLQRRQHRRGDLLAIVGRVDCARGVRRRGRQRGRRDGSGRGDTCPRRVCEDARQSRSAAGRRRAGHACTERHVPPRSPVARIPVVARPRIPDAGGGDGGGPVRSNRVDCPPVLVARPCDGRAEGGPDDGIGNGMRDRRANRRGAGDAARGRSPAHGVRGIRGPAAGLRRAPRRERASGRIDPPGRRAVRLRYRQRDLVATAGGAGRVHPGRCPARGRPDRRDRPGNLCVRAGDVRRSACRLGRRTPRTIGQGTAWFFVAAGLVQGVAIACLLAGRRTT